ncbi:MAG: DUF6475 domain-containing protein [Rickettsiella sp.]|nr:DUF6475 domain-containing protein [Rickettsiella sp.]
MNSTDRMEFTQGLMMLAEIYNRKLSELLLQTYWNCLKPYSLELFKSSLESFLRDPDYALKGFPSPSAWIKAIEGDSASKSLTAWTQVVQAIRCIGHYESVVFSDSLIHKVIQEMGGWILLCRQSERELSFSQKEFERRYRKYAAFKKKIVAPDYLPGQIEHQNRARGFSDAIPHPIQIDRTLCMLSDITVDRNSAKTGITRSNLQKFDSNK